MVEIFEERIKKNLLAELNVVLLSHLQLFRFIVKPNDSIVVHGSEIFKAIMRALGLNGRTIQYAMEYIKMTPF